mmetsp:Transcript_54784/g.154218  ORF Transcript_54784/g.154218 Transcript_54784/m.154218 type:complete len:205 (-) Transcript_54784:1755-2369(-)
MTASRPAHVIPLLLTPRYVTDARMGTSCTRPSSPRPQLASSSDRSEKLSFSFWVIHMTMSAQPWGPSALSERSRLRRFGDRETRFSRVAWEAAVRLQLDSERSVRPMLRHSAMMPRPSSPTGFLFSIMTCRSCVSAAPWSRKSSIVRSVKPMSSRYIVRILLCSIALPMWGAPMESILLPERFISRRVSQLVIMLPMASAASAV